jgi:hypothetical protein
VLEFSAISVVLLHAFQTFVSIEDYDSVILVLSVFLLNSVSSEHSLFMYLPILFQLTQFDHLIPKVKILTLIVPLKFNTIFQSLAYILH